MDEMSRDGRWLFIAAAALVTLALPLLSGGLCESRGPWRYVLIGAALGAVLIWFLGSRVPAAQWAKTALAATSSLLGRGSAWASGIGLLAVVLRIVFLSLVGHGDPLPDASIYEKMALGVLHGEGLHWHKTVAYWPPGYSLLLAAVYKLFGENREVIRLLQAVLGGISCSLIYLIGRKQSDVSARAASVLFAFAPTHIAFSNILRYETFAVFLELLGIWLLSSRFQRGNGLSTFGGGVVLGLCALVRPPVLFLLPLILVVLGLSRCYQSRTELLHRATLALVGVALVLSPWVIRNTILLHRPVLLSTNGGVNFWIGNNPQATGRYMDPPPLSGPTDEVTADMAFLKRGVAYVMSSPGSWLKLMLAKLLCTVDPFTIDRQWRIDTINIHRDFRRFETLQVFYNLLLLLLVLVAGMRRRLLGHPVSSVAFAVCLFWVLLGGVFFVQPRGNLLFLPCACLLAGTNAAVADRMTRDTPLASSV